MTRVTAPTPATNEELEYIRERVQLEGILPPSNVAIEDGKVLVITADGPLRKSGWEVRVLTEAELTEYFFDEVQAGQVFKWALFARVEPKRADADAAPRTQSPDFEKIAEDLLDHIRQDLA